MANKRQIGYGASGEDVKNLQIRLNQTGNYNLAEDGIYGSNTQAAVKDYQHKNGLATDGIVGNQTWASLETTGAKPATKNATTTQQTTTSTTQPTQPASTGYQQSDTVAQAQQMLHDYMAQKPGAYQSTWQGQLDEIMAQIMNRQPFQYDVNSDALYQQYKDQYMAQGQQAMMDTMGQAAALTGGYGNSYAQTAGQQTYQGYLQQLNDKIPDLYQLALSKYQMEGDALANQYAMLGAREDQDYGRYRDSVSDYYTELDRLYNQYNTERDYDYGQYIDNRNYEYQVGRDTVADQQWQAQYDEAIRQWQAEFDENQRRYDQEWEKANSNSGGGSGGRSGSSSGSSTGTGATIGAAVGGLTGATAAAEKEKEARLNTAYNKFSATLPYPHAGSDISTWKMVVSERLAKACYEGKYTEEERDYILKKMGLPEIV